MIYVSKEAPRVFDHSIFVILIPEVNKLVSDPVSNIQDRCSVIVTIDTCFFIPLKRNHLDLDHGRLEVRNLSLGR